MNKKNTTLKFENLRPSAENVNSSFESCYRIVQDILESGWRSDSRIFVAGDNVARHEPGDIIQGHNRYQAITLIREAGGLKQVFGDKELIPVTVVSNATEADVADLYNDNGLQKSITYLQVVLKARKYFQAGCPESKVCSALQSNFDQLSPLKGDKLLKAKQLEQDLASGKLTPAAYTADMLNIRRGYVQAIKAWCSSQFLIDCLTVRETGESDNPQAIALTNSEGKDLARALSKDRELEKDGSRQFYQEDLDSGTTPHFAEKFQEIKARKEQKAAEATKPQGPTMLKKGEIEGLLKIVDSRYMQKVLKAVLQAEGHLPIAELDKELKALEKGEPKAAEPQGLKVVEEVPTPKPQAITGEAAEKLKALIKNK